MARKFGGYQGKGLRVNLSTGRITVEDTYKYLDVIGGTGLGYKVFWDEVAPKTKAYDEANKIVFAVSGGDFPPTLATLSERLRQLEANHPVELDRTAQKILERARMPHGARQRRR